MVFSPSKCCVLRVCRSMNPLIHPMLGQTLQSADDQPYLEFTLSEDLDWRTHILNIRNKTNSALGFVERNLHRCPQKVKDQAYKSLVRPPLECGSTVWDLYRAYPKSCLEQVRRRAARLVPRTYANEKKCVTNALKQLNWPTLEKNKTSSYTDADVTNQAAIDRTSVLHKTQGILSTQIYST